jgi:hypothetical protein
MQIQLELTADERRVFAYLDDQERRVYFEQLMQKARSDLAGLFAAMEEEKLAPSSLLSEIKDPPPLPRRVEKSPAAVGVAPPPVKPVAPPPVNPLDFLTPEERRAVLEEQAEQAREEREWERRIARARTTRVQPPVRSAGLKRPGAGLRVA